jgi:hypothetical protein
LLRRYLTMIVLFGLLTACGGGGGGNGPPPPVVSTLTFQFKSAWGAYQQQSTTVPITLSGTAYNASLGSYAITGSGTVTQTWGTSTQPNMDGSASTVQAIMVTRVYRFTALVHGISVPQILTDVSYYDPTSYAYMGGTYTDSSGNPPLSNVLLAGWTVPPDTLQCCNSGTSFYQTAIAPGGPVVHDILLGVAADTANSVLVNLTDSTPSGNSRIYRLDNTNTLTIVQENINAVASVMTTGGTYLFNAAVTFHY